VLPWILTIARRLLIDRVRRADHALVWTDDIESLAMSSQTARPDEMLHARQLARRFEHALKRLPQPQRTAFQLVKHDLLSPTEAAKELAITVDALRVRLFRANQALRRTLAKIAPEAAGQPGRCHHRK
jgi:RNA polymerase sigma-70 factor, ECF subfamily